MRIKIILTRRLTIKELKTNFVFNCARTEALNHIHTTTIKPSCIISIRPWPFINISMAATDPKQLETSIPVVAPAK